ncbi:efflux RND transporter periplasmic adaptor subunit [Pseudogemmatithrix spongiicola]|uniref:Efflux RND transporter periplasmic adaptor subunit n=1 Tax=Pseudogemmatithrix spongiicola TaxID=3062599 RepID=A0AA49Q638_9BACT|nr:efflux RND transporter periplasmic adaptor subunit [Gemmatimonadaceae bacterium 'strain 138']WKW13993.1 efflux RND transporter periplasmic adaptor subunit [Gemmatimonadaceae bacterium 'strain 318']
MSPRRLSLAFLAALGLVAACGKKAAAPLRISTAPIERRTIIVQAEATGIIEPINVVEVKSRASGQIIEMPVETGSLINPGELIVQLDTRDVQNQFDQSKADLESAQASLAVAEQNKKRSDELFRSQIITAQENEQAGLTYQNALSQIVRARTNLDLAQQRLDDARVVAPVRGTVIEKPVALGQVIQSGTQAVGGGTTIIKMADLTKVRARALVNETDIGRVMQGQEATVIVDAFPDRPFRGTVEKIEPQAVVQQNVTMFPVLVSLENREGLLLPGMNGEVSIISDRRENVIAVPNEAIRSVREVAQVAGLLGLNADSVQAQLRSAMGGGFGGGAPMGMNGGARPQGGPPAGGAQARPGYADFSAQQGGRQGGQGGFQMPDVTDAQCKAVADARAAKPAVARRLDSLQTAMRSNDADRPALMGGIRAAYTELGVDAMVARACLARQQGGGARTAGPAAPTGQPTPARNGPRALQAPGAQTGGAARNGGSRAGSRSGLVFVQKADSTWEPRMVRLGVADYDYTEVLSGLEEGEQVALLSAVALQAQRQENQDRMRAMTGGASPLGGAPAGPGGGRPR